MALQDGLNNLLAKTQGVLGNPLAAGAIGAATGAAVVGTGLAIASAVKKKRRKAPAKKRTATRRKTTTRRKSPRRKTYKYARTAGKRKDTSTRRIRMTKNGQPYVILKSGKARFISKASAAASRRRKGGRY